MDRHYKLIELNLSSDWTIVKHEFYDIDPEDNVPEEDKDFHVFLEDILQITKNEYVLDLGWYGGNNLADEHSGFAIHLFRGKNWNNAELLKKFRSKKMQVVSDKISEFIEAVDFGLYDKLIGYRVDENDPDNMNDFGDLDVFSTI